MVEITSNVTSDEGEEIELYPEPESSDGNPILRNDQSDVTVASQVLQGIKLRAKKSPKYLRSDRFPVIINLPKPHIVRKRKARMVLSNSCPGCSHWPIPPCSKSMMTIESATRKTRLKYRIKAENKTICPMRIAELAVPTKRHCIDTWRNKAYLLPEFMVDRLKQCVMDQRPVVQIPEAVYYFKKRKFRQHKKKSAKDTLSCWKKQMEIPLRYQTTRTLCLIFAQKIVQKLLTPLKIKLSSDYENISRVVVSDIVRITKGKKFVKTAYLQKYRTVHSDAINKITAWIVGILEVVAYKQLEEDLRDLEEEEGPVLDFIDDLLENVFSICIPPEVYIEEKFEKSITSDSLTSKHSGDELSITEYFKNELSDLISNFTVEDIDDNQIQITQAIDDTLSEKDDLFTEINVILNNILKESVSSNDTFNNDYDKVTDIEYFKNEIIHLINIVCKESGDKMENVNNDTILTLEDNIENAQLTETNNSGSNFKGSMDFISEDTDDRSKKVMFSVSAIVTPSHAAYSIPSELAGIPCAQKESINSFSSFFKNIIFAKPNDHLLSDADELWPKNFSPAILRPSASVTKSITSLGILSEGNETDLSWSLIDSSIDEQENLYAMIIDNKVNQSTITLTESPDRDELFMNQQTPLVKSSETLLTLQDYPSFTNYGQRHEKQLTADETKMLTPKLNKGVQVSTKRRDNESQTNKLKATQENLGTCSTIITSLGPDEIANKFNNKKISSSKKETLETIKNNETMTEPSENKLTFDSRLTNTITLTQCDICKWCKDLDNGFENLEIWQDWLQNICKETTDLLKKKKQHACLKKYMKQWRMLKNDVDEDAVLWQNINQNTQETFKCYQKYYGRNKFGKLNCNGRCFCKTDASITT